MYLSSFKLIPNIKFFNFESDIPYISLNSLGRVLKAVNAINYSKFWEDQSYYWTELTEVQDSNMSKLGSDGKPIYNEQGKVMKGPNYFKPNLKKYL